MRGRRQKREGQGRDKRDVAGRGLLGGNIYFILKYGF